MTSPTKCCSTAQLEAVAQNDLVDLLTRAQELLEWLKQLIIKWRGGTPSAQALPIGACEAELLAKLKANVLVFLGSTPQLAKDYIDCKTNAIFNPPTTPSSMSYKEAEAQAINLALIIQCGISAAMVYWQTRNVATAAGQLTSCLLAGGASPPTSPPVTPVPPTNPPAGYNPSDVVRCNQ